MSNTIQLPQELYDAVQRKATAQQKTTDALVIEWVAEHLDETRVNETVEVFEREVEAFERLRPALLESYAGQFVAIYQGEVVATGDDKLLLLHQIRERFGDVVCYIEKVTADSPRIVRMPSMRLTKP